MSYESDEKELEDLTAKLKAGLDIKDRKYLLKTYPKCFIGSEAVTYMLDNNICKSREEGGWIGKALLAAGIIEHVTNDHDFMDNKKFYHFMDDKESHGHKAKTDNDQDWSWNDFIPGKIKNLYSNDDEKDNKYSLQPKIEELNAEVETAIDALDLAPKETFGITPLDEYNKKLLDNTHPIKWENPKPAGKYNLVAIGAGTAGLVTAAVAAGMGAKCAIIEEHMFGGDCLNFGCVPSKAILRSAKIAYDAIIRGKEFGVNVTNGGKIEMDFGAVMERVRKCRSKISSHDAAERFTKVYGMDVFIGKGKFLSTDTIGVFGIDGDESKESKPNCELKFARCVIGTGAKASVPPIDGLKDVMYLTNQTVWNLTERPARLGVIGSGPIGSELAQAFALLGSDVTVLNRSDRILGKEDIDAANVVKKSMEKCGVKFVTGLKFKNVSYKDKSIGFKSGIVVTIENNKKDGAEEKYEFDHVIIATGRKPNVSGLDLEKAKVKYDKRKGIEVNDYLQTTNSNVYAAGDCCTRYQFTHMADAMAKIVLRNALFFGRSKVSNLVIPWATYTFPEVAHVGLYGTDLKDKGIAFDEYKVDIEHNDRAVCDGEDEHGGFVKVLCKKGSDKILGATIVSDNAGDIINEYTLAIQTNTGLGFFTGVIHPYPTVAECVSASASAYIKTKLTPLNKVLLRRILQARR